MTNEANGAHKHEEQGMTMTETTETYTCEKCNTEYKSFATYTREDACYKARQAQRFSGQGFGPEPGETVNAGSGRDGHSAAAAMAKADFTPGQGGAGNGTSTSATGATPKQRDYIAALAAERGLEVEARWLASKAGASAAIDHLLTLPRQAAAAAPAGPAHPATDKQKTFARTLLAERAGNPAAEEVRNTLNEARLANNLSVDVLSAAITALLEIPKEAPVEIEAGVYVLANGNLARVYFGQQSGGMLLKEVVDGELEYRGKAERFLAGSRKATVEEVGNWGRATGTCLVCARRLDDPESVDRGIGPVCYAKMGGA